MRTCSEDGCGVKHYGRGLCRKHYQRAKFAGTLTAAPRHQLTPDTPLDERLRHHGWTVTDSGCWEWAKGLNGNGYGQLAVGTNRPMIASRAAHLAWIGPIPDGAVVCHRCDNPPCINPEHLFLGTRADNNRDMFNKNRQARGEMKQHKLTDAQVDEIRARYAAGGSTQRSLADEYGVGQQMVSLLTRGERRALPTHCAAG